MRCLHNRLVSLNLLCLIALVMASPLPGLSQGALPFSYVPDHFPRDRNYLKSFGGPGGTPAEEGKFNRCHGLTVDTRAPKPLLIVCNRESGRVEHWDTHGHLVAVLQRNLRMPATAYVAGDYVAIGELQGRVTILGKDNRIVAQIGDNPNTSQRANYGLDPSEWTEGICNSPHGVAIDKAGDVIVSVWSIFGRLLLFAVRRSPTKR